MRKIAHVITTIERGGAENQLLILAREQRETGLEVTVIPLKGEPELLAEFSSSGIDLNLSLLNSGFLKQTLILRKILKSFAITHAHLPRAEILVAIACRNKFLFTRHNTEPFFPGAPKAFSVFLSRFVTFRASRGIAISKAVKEYLISHHEISTKFPLDTVLYGIPPKDVIKVPWAHDVEFHYKLTNSEFIVGTVARLTPQKDLPTLLKSFSIVSDKMPNALLVVIGVGPEFKSLMSLAYDLGISNNLVWVGKTSKIPEYLSIFDVFVLTSIYEGFGLVLAEAMVASCPIVASNNSAIPEVIGAEHPGLAETSNPGDFATKIQLMADPEIRNEVLQRQKSQLFSLDPTKMAIRIQKIYECC